MDSRLDELIAKDAIVDVVNRLFIGTDSCDWSVVHECFAPTVHFDMTSIGDGEPLSLTPMQITDRWEEGLRGLDAIHHQVGNHIVTIDDDHATVFCYGIASHYIKDAPGGSVRIVVGTYDINLHRSSDHWRIDLLRFNLKYMDGNVTLGESAAATDGHSARA